MLTPEQITRRALNRYPDFLRALCTGQPIFPLTIFGGGMAKAKDFADDRAAIEALRMASKEQLGFGYEISWEERTFRRIGTQKVPGAVILPSQADYIRLLKKEVEVRRFRSDYDHIVKHCPELDVWVRRKPLRVVEHAGGWEQLVDVCVYLRENPRPGCYLRELPVIADTKFIEGHKGILGEILPIAAPKTVGTDDCDFEARFGFRRKQPLVRMRFLDAQIGARLGLPVSEFATPLDQFRKLHVAGAAVIIVENEMTFLTLPKLRWAVAIYGAGDAAALLSNVGWLASCPMLYWGDLDSHGFETLSNLRRAFPRVASVLMDERTFADHARFAVKAKATRTRGKLDLRPAEQRLYDRLVAEGTLLEQERVPNAYSACRLEQAIDTMIAVTPVEPTTASAL